MGCKGSKHALLHEGCGPPPEPRGGSGRLASSRRRHSVALRSAAALGTTLSLDRAAAAVAAVGVSFDADAFAGGGDDEGMMKAGNDVVGGAAGKLLGPSRSFAGWCPATPPVAVPLPKRQKRVVVAAAPQPPPRLAPRTPTKTPVHGPPEEINLWELMKGLDDEEDGEGDDDDDQEEKEDGHGNCVERKAQSAPGSPVFDPEILDAFRKALDELTPGSPLPDSVKRGGDGVEKREIQMFPGIVRARVNLLQEKINAKTKLAKKASPPPLLPPPPESAGRVVVYLTSLRGIRQTYEDCWSTSAILRGYNVRVDERDLSMHAGFKDELRAALVGDGGRLPRLPQVFADGRHLGGAEEVRRLHEDGELAAALEACDAAAARAGKGGGVAAASETCSGCGGVRFVPCDVCSGSCKVFVEDEDGDGDGDGIAGAFRRCPECNENGLVRCPVC
jgi:glutaredoxin domain-containing cysteine-rich protein 1